MGFEALRESIETRMADNWSTTEVAYENVPFTPPAGPWVRLQINLGEGGSMGILGSAVTVRDQGVISLQVFVPEGQGSKAANDLVDALITIYEHQRFDGITTYTASPRAAGITNGWHQTNITIPFRRARYV